MSLLTLSIVVFLIVQVLDVWTTMEGIERGAHEVNETIADWMEEHGETGWIKRKLGFSLFCLAGMAVAGYPVVIFGVSAILGCVVLWNLYTIYKMSG